MEKTTIFNLIILDESGSMTPLTGATIEGCNSVINSSRQVQKENADSQRLLMSIYAFQSRYSDVPSRYIVQNEPVEKVADISTNDYRPNGCTPLYDAIGTTLTDLEAVAKTHQDSTGIITIITDGMENDSHHFTHADVVKLIDRFKEMGWAVNFVGANIDVERVADKLHIDNRQHFDHSVAGMRNAMASIDVHSREVFCEEKCYCDFSPEEKLARRKERSKRFFSKK